MSRLLALAAATAVLAGSYLLGQHPDVTNPGTTAHTARALLALAITIPAAAGILTQDRTRKDHDQ